jgi:hypothetical protein
MALHRDIYWVGRQWAVTGHGLQACDQKQKGKFDIEAARLWDDGLVETMHAKEWLNAADFDKGLEIARTRYPEQPRNGAEPTKEPPKAAPPLPAARLEEPKPQEPVPIDLKQTIAEIEVSMRAKRSAVDPPKPVLPAFQVRFPASAKFVRPWRVRQKK